MAEPPPKRMHRADYDSQRSRPGRDSTSPIPRSPRPADGRGGRGDERGVRRNRSRSPRETKYNRRDRSRSHEVNREKDKAYRDRSPDRHHEDGRDNRGERQYARNGEKSRRYSRSRSRSRSPPRKTNGVASARAGFQPPLQPSSSRNMNRVGRSGPDLKHEGGEMEVDAEDGGSEAEMKRLMGFATFKSTKNTKVPGNQIYGVRKEKKTEYRQYMNRVGGFNRPLSPSR